MTGTVLLLAATIPAAESAAGPRYPADLALDPAERWILTANEESSSVTILDRNTGEAVDELALTDGGRPRSIDAAWDGNRRLVAAVGEAHVHSIAVLAVEVTSTGPRWKLRACIATGRRPADVALRAGASQILVACEGDGELWVHAANGGAPARRITAVEGACRVAPLDALHLHGRALTGLAAVGGRTEIAVVDIENGEVRGRHAPAGGISRNLGGLWVDGRHLWISHQVQATEAPIDPQTIGWGLILANRVTRIAIESLVGAAQDPASEWVYPLDDGARSAGDPGRPAGGAGGVLVVPSAGMQRIVFTGSGPDDRYDYRHRSPALSSYDSVAGLAVGARPVAVAATADGERAYVACSLDDTVVEVDLERRSVRRTLRLGPAPQDTAAHRGARIFFDANRSRDGWYSCQSCHPDGGTAGHRFNTRADDGGEAKRSPSLFGVEASRPWAWAGKFDRLEEQVEASMHFTMAVDAAPSRRDVLDVVAYLRALPRPRPTRAGDDLGGNAGEGAGLFATAGCADCHTPPAYTSAGLHDIGLAPDAGGTSRYNPPSLIGVRDRHRYLHDGRAPSLEAVFRGPHAAGPHRRAGELSDRELGDLLAFIKTL